jgi:predicted ArsR family transcriptional regulator
MNIHKHFDQLTEREQERVGDAYRELTAALGHDLPIDNDDTAERVVDAIARGILETRAADAKRKAERADNERFAKFIENLVRQV